MMQKLGALLDGRPADMGAVRNAAKVKIVAPGDGQKPSGVYEAASGRPAEALPLTAAATRELLPSVKPKAPDGFVGNAPFPDIAQQRAFRAAAHDAGFRVPKEIVQRLKDFSAPWLRLSDAMARYSDSAAREEHAKHLSNIAKRIADGDVTQDDTDAWTAQEWQDDFRLRRNSIKTAMRQIETEARTAAQPVLDDFADALIRAADSLEVPIREQAESLVFNYTPPPSINSMRRHANLIRSGAQLPMGDPAALLTVL